MATDDRPEVVARRLASTQHGLVTRAGLRTVGLSHNQIAHLTHSERWQPLSEVVFVLVGTPATTLQRSLAAVLDSGPDAALSHLSVGAAYGLSGCPLEPFTVCRTSHSRQKPTLARVRTVRSLPDRWRTVLDGVPVVRPELLALQLYAVCTADRAERLVDKLWSMRLLSGRTIALFLAQMGRSGRNGAAGLRLYLEPRGLDYTPPATGIESRTKQILDAAGIELRPQVDSGSEETWTGRVDFRHVDLPLIVEVQSAKYHLALVDREADAVRLAALRAAGYVVVELWDTEVWTRPDLVVAKVRAGLDECMAARRRGRR